MSAVVSPPTPTRCRALPRGKRQSRRLSRPSGGAPRSGETIVAGSPLFRYVDDDGHGRELLAIPGHAGSVLVLDRDATTLCDRRLVAHLAADEPHENAVLVCRDYLEHAGGRWCRLVCREDLEIAPFAEREEYDAQSELDRQDACVVDCHGNSYRLALITGERRNVQLRWCRRFAGAGESTWEQAPLREVIGVLECYEPMRTLTERALACHSEDPHVSLTRLRHEFERLCASPVVLNRGVREAVLDAIARNGTSMSEIALRCGVVKRDRRGKVSGETSWLARRIGVMPEGGEKTTTPWIHSDVLAAIARNGLGVSPREVELQ
jgi:hypothetical protein